MEVGDIVGLKEPLTKLVECIRDATGVLYEPRRIRKRAEAEAEAAIILANGEIQKNELLRKAAERLASSEIRRQENLEAIVAEAAKLSVGKELDAKPEKDWMTNFFEESKDVSDAEIQKVWAKILANEVDKPGQYSRKTLAILRQLGKREASLFHKVCTMCWTSNSGDTFIPLDARNHSLVQECGVSFDDCQELETLGLMYANPMLAISITNHTVLKYFDISLGVNLGKSNATSKMRCFTLTKYGKELYRALNLSPDYQMLNLVKSRIDTSTEAEIFSIT